MQTPRFNKYTATERREFDMQVPRRKTSTKLSGPSGPVSGEGLHGGSGRGTGAGMIPEDKFWSGRPDTQLTRSCPRESRSIFVIYDNRGSASYLLSTSSTRPSDSPLHPRLTQESKRLNHLIPRSSFRRGFLTQKAKGLEEVRGRTDCSSSLICSIL